MVDETPNHKFDKYQHGERPWGHQTDLDHIEENLTVRDVEAKLDEYTPHGGATFIATDSGAVYDGTGSQWIPARREFADLKVANEGDAGLWGGSGDHVILASHHIAPNTILSTSSTSYVDLTEAPQRPMIHTGRIADLDNVNRKEVSFICVLSAGTDSANAYARIATYREGALTETEISRGYAAGGYVTSAWAPYETGSTDRISLQGRINTASGTCSIHSATVYVAGVID